MNKIIALAAGLLFLTGCASSKVGAACYVPYGVSGSCQITTVEPGGLSHIYP